jgi:hypothetical protein
MEGHEVCKGSFTRAISLQFPCNFYTVRFSSFDGCERVYQSRMFGWGSTHSAHSLLIHSFTSIKRRKEKMQRKIARCTGLKKMVQTRDWYSDCQTKILTRNTCSWCCSQGVDDFSGSRLLLFQSTNVNILVAQYIWFPKYWFGLHTVWHLCLG